MKRLKVRINNWNCRLLLSLCLTGNIFTASSCLKIKKKKNRDVTVSSNFAVSWWKMCLNIVIDPWLLQAKNECFMFFSCTKAEWREVEGRMMVTMVTIIHHHDTTHSYRSSSRTKVVHATNEKGEPRDKVCKIAASFNSDMWKHFGFLESKRNKKDSL